MLKRLLNFLFPPVCVVCNKSAHYFCANCQDKIDFLYFQPKLPLLVDQVDQVKILGFYTPPLSVIIKALKYQSLSPIGPILGDLLHKHLQFPSQIDCVTAVPLHPKRWRQRGYNQAELIARQLAIKLNKPYQPLLIRQHHTQNLASTSSDEERTKLIDHAFVTNPDFKEKMPTYVLIVDDVVTTGSTLAACAKTLKQAGVQQITAVTLAHEG
jgi:ComF family protein